MLVTSSSSFNTQCVQLDIKLRGETPFGMIATTKFQYAMRAIRYKVASVEKKMKDYLMFQYAMRAIRYKAKKTGGGLC